MSNIYSTKEELEKIRKILIGYIKLPFSGDTIPGALMENILGNVRSSIVLNTYDFVDVLNEKESIGWQVKSTKDSTPVTWKRAKIENAQNLIKESYKSEKALQHLGNSIIGFCNDHAKESFKLYGLDEIGYARLIIHKDKMVTYFERSLCTKASKKIFEEQDFTWRWSTPKKTKKKEQLPALHGFYKNTEEKWFAWHGLGENQLHFSGEKSWWPKTNSNKIVFQFPDERLSQKQFMELLASIS